MGGLLGGGKAYVAPPSQIIGGLDPPPPPRPRPSYAYALSAEKSSKTICLQNIRIRY